MDIIFLICIFFLGWFIGNRILLNSLRNAIEKEAKTLGINLHEEDNSEPHVLFTEKENNTILVFDKNTNAFIAQGATLEEAASRTKIKKAEVQHENQTVWFVNGKVKTILE